MKTISKYAITFSVFIRMIVFTVYASFFIQCEIFDLPTDPEPIIISKNGSYHIKGKDKVAYIEVKPGVTADITLSNVHIKRELGYACAFSIEGSDVTLNLEGSNSFSGGFDTPGIELLGGSLTINGPGKLEATGNAGGAGIGGGGIRGKDFDQLVSIITINSGTIIANGGRVGAGIGAGYYSSGDTTFVIINGGHITANGSEYGDGIGFGYGASSVYIMINEGTVYADGVQGEKFGNGRSGSSGIMGNRIIINGGCVTAIGGKKSYDDSFQHSIYCSADPIQISGGMVIAASDGIAYSFITNGNSIVFNNRNKDDYYSLPETEAPSIHLMSPEVAIDPNGNITLNTNLTVPPGSTLTIPPGCTFTLAKEITLSNDGSIMNYGTIDSRNGKITGNITNKGNGKVLLP